MKLQTRIKHINKRLTKYSRLLFVTLSVVGIVLSFFISDINKFQVSKADTLVGANAGVVTTNLVKGVYALKDGSERLVSVTNQWSSSDIQINSHYNAADYNDYNVCDTGINYATNANAYFVDDNGSVFVIDSADNNLEFYSFNDCLVTTTAISNVTLSDELTYGLIFDYDTGDLYAIQDTRLIRFPQADYGDAEAYNYTNLAAPAISVSVNDVDNGVYVLLDNGYVLEYEQDNAFNVLEYDLSSVTTCTSKIVYRNTQNYISDNCNNEIYQFDNTFTLQQTYSLADPTVDFAVNNNYIYAAHSSYVTKFDIGSPLSSTISNNLSDVTFVNIDYIGNNPITFSSFYRDIYKFTLTIGSGSGCTVVTPPYIQNGTRCERWVYSSSTPNHLPAQTSTHSVSTTYGTMVIRQDVSGEGGIYDSYNDTFVSFPTGYYYPIEMDAISTAATVFVLFEQDDNVGGGQSILTYDITSATFGGAYALPGGQEYSADFVIDSLGNLITINHDGPGLTSLTVFPVGDYLNPITIDPDFDFADNDNVYITVDSNHNLYAVQYPDLRVINYNSGAYDISGLYDLSGENISNSTDIAVKTNSVLGGEDVYISGSTAGAISTVVKITGLGLDGTAAGSTQNFTSTYGNYSSYLFSEVIVDDYDNVFAVPSSSSTQIAWFSPNGTEHEFDLTDSDGLVMDIVLDNSNNLFVTSEFIDFQRFNYDFEIAATPDICQTEVPPYLENYTRCERYISNPLSNNSTLPEFGESYVENVIDNNIFFASTDANRLYANNNFYPLPGGYTGISRLKADNRYGVTGVYFITLNSGGQSEIMHFDYDSTSFDYSYNTQTTYVGTLDYAVKPNGNVYVISQTFGNTSILEFEEGTYDTSTSLALNYSFAGSCSPSMEIVTSGDVILLCGPTIYGLSPSDYLNTTYTLDLSTHNFDSSYGQTNIFVDERYDNNIDLYISGITSAVNGKVQKFVSFNTTTGGSASNSEYTDAIFTGVSITDIYIQNNSGIFASSDSLNTELMWVNTQGSKQIISVSDYGNIADIVVDNNYNLYVTSKDYLYQFFEFDFVPLTVTGSTACTTGGDLSLNTITAGTLIHTNSWVDGNPDTPPPYPSGYLEIRANGLPISESLLDGSANISHDFTIFNPGTYTITLFYNGDDNFAGCTATLGTVEVQNASGGYLTSQTVITSVVPSNLRQVTGEDLVITATVTDPNTPSNIPTGSLELRHDICCSGAYNVLGTGTIDINGQITFTLSDLLPGGYTIHAHYLGDPDYTSSDSIAIYVNIYAIQSFTTLSTSDSSVVKGDQITLSAHVSMPNFTPGISSPVEITGYVRFRIGTAEIGWDLVDSNGDAQIVIDTSDNPIQPFNINEGVHHIRAHYEPRHDLINFWMRPSQSETVFQTVAETDNSGGSSNTGTDTPPSGGQGGNSDFTATITGKDKATGSLTQTKIGSILSWVMSHNNLGPNSNQAVTYFPVRENQDFVVGSVVAPASWTIQYTQDQGCDDSTFNYTPVGTSGQTDPLVRCVRFTNDRVEVPPTRSDIRYITTSSNFGELNVQAIGGRDVYDVIPYNNKIFYFNHHWLVDRTMLDPLKTMFCFDLEINDTCVSSNPAIVYPVVMGQDGFSDIDDEYIVSKTSFAVNAEIVNDKMYIPMTDVTYSDGIGNGHGFLCWDLLLDFYCSGSSFKQGVVILSDYAINAWGWGNIGDIEFNPDMQELYSINVSGDSGYMQIVCYSTALNAPCVGQPYIIGNFQGYDHGWSITKYQASTGRIYSSSGGSTAALDRQIQCTIAATKQRCPDFPEGGVQILPDKPNQSVFINPANDQMCAFLYTDGAGVTEPDYSSPRIYCYNDDTQSFYDYLPALEGSHFASDMFHDFEGPNPSGRIYFMAKWGDTVIQCYDLNTGEQCAGWEGGKASSAPFDDLIYTFTYAFGCMWGASDSGRVFTFDENTGEACNPLITLSEGSVAVTLDANNMFCSTNPDDITWNKVKVLDSGTTPSPALLNTSVYDSTQCTTDINDVITCTGSPLKTGNLLLNSGHELDISDIDYNTHKSLTAILEFQYPSIPSPAPGFYIELNPTNKAQMCAETKLTFTGALCANPITTVCENTNISYINDPVSNNNGGQYCLNVETYFGKDPNSSLCFVATNPEQRIFTVFNPNATVSTGDPTDFNPEETYNRTPESYSFGNGFFGFVQNIIETTIPQIVNEDSVRNVVQSFGTQTPLAVTAVTAVTTATVVATSVVAAGSGIGQIFGVLLGFLAPRKRKYWGIIFDDLTNKPIAFASITLSVKEIGTNNQIKTSVITQSVSDLDGRYRLNTDKRDKFYLEVKASGYQPYAKFISMANPLNSAEDIVYDIPLRRLDAKVSFIKTLLNYKQKGFINIARAILLVTSIVGFLFTIYSQINFPNNLNIILILVYVFIFIITFYPSIYLRIQKRGKVMDVDFNSPIPGAVVRIYDTKQQIALSLTNTKGEARFDLPAGEYSILASKRGYIMVVEQGKQLIKATLKTEGYLDRNILLKRIEEAPAQATGSLDNPFA